MIVKNIVFELMLFLGGSLIGAQGATFYVSTNGSDANPGSSAQPFRTITHAYSQASAGTTILVAPGTYTDYTSGWGIHLGSSGTASNPIILRSQVRGGAIINRQFASDGNMGIYLDGSYNVVDGFVITQAPDSGIFIDGNDNQILNDEIDDNGAPNEGMGIYSNQGTSGNIYEDNYIHDNGQTGNTLEHGMYLCGQNEVVANNVVIRNAACGLQIAGYTSVSNLKVYNNVFAWNGADGIILWMTLSGVAIENNIIYQNADSGIGSWAAVGSGVVIDQNLSSGNGSGDYALNVGGSTFTYTLGTTVSADPLFANETSASFDAHLSAGSPAIGAGVNFYSLFTNDMAGAARAASGAWDLGAYVYGSSGSSSNTTPPSVTVTSPGSGTTVSGVDVSVLASASSSIGIAGVQFELDGTNIGPVFTTSPYGGSWNSTTVPDGSHTFTAVATDIAGNHTSATPVTFLVSNDVSTLSLPAISVTASPATAYIGTTNDAIVTFSRTGETSQSLTVNYSLGGTAVGGTDYVTTNGDMPVSVTIPAGAILANVTIVGVANSTGANPETASFTVATNAGYTIGPAGSATVTIVGNINVTPPVITITATTPNASRVGLTAGAFTLARTGNTASSLTVNYALSGTAVNGTDYAALGASVTIPAGAASATIPVTPLPSTNYVGAETAVLALSANSAYTAGSPASATVNIAGNSVPVSIVTSNHNAKITWHSTVGKVYRVAYKTSLSASTWTNLSSLITATSTTTSYTDTTVSKNVARYFAAYVAD